MVEFSSDFPFKRRSTDRVEPPAADNIGPALVSTPNPTPTAPRPPQVEVAPVNAAPMEAAPVVSRKPAVERRKLMRDKMTAPGLIHPDHYKGPPIKVSLIDISVAGIRFSAPQPLDVGDKLQIRVEAGPFRWTTRMRVIHCTRSESASIIGCAFLRTELLRPWPIAA